LLSVFDAALLVLGASRRFGVEVFDAGLGVPSPPVGPRSVVFVDAGSRAVRRGAGEASVVKLSVVMREAGSWRVLHPAVPGGRRLPFLVVDVGGPAREGLVYLVELASLLSWLDAGVEAAVKHGPLQQVYFYLNRRFDVPRRVVEAGLRYAGLGDGAVGEVLEGSELCGGRGVHNLGLAMLAVLSRLREHAGRGAAVAGVVEDVSRSRVLLLSLVEEAVAGAWRRAGGGPLASAAEVGGLLYGAAVEALEEAAARAGYGGVDGFLGDCICGATGPADRGVFEGFVAALAGELRRYTQMDPGSAPRGLLGLAASRLLQGVGDAPLLSWLYYLGAGGGAAATVPRAGYVAFQAAVEELERRRRELVACRGGVEGLAGPLEAVRSFYLAPDPPPSCGELRGLSGGAAPPCMVARALRVPVPFRVEALAPGPGAWPPRGPLGDVVGLLYWSARLAAYKYPAPLLLADRFSRVGPGEAEAAGLLAELLSRRRVPYSMVLHGWETRASM